MPTGDWSWGGLLQVQLRVQELSVSFSRQGANGDVDIINSAVTTEPSVQGRRWRSFMGRLEHTWGKSPKGEPLKWLPRWSWASAMKCDYMVSSESFPSIKHLSWQLINQRWCNSLTTGWRWPIHAQCDRQRWRSRAWQRGKRLLQTCQLIANIHTAIMFLSHMERRIWEQFFSTLVFDTDTVSL